MRAAVITEPTVSIDKADYFPGETVIITGSGFASGETVTLQVMHDDGTVEGGEGHEPFTTVADADANFTPSWYVNPDDSLGRAFTLTATGSVSGLSARTNFTDGFSAKLQGRCNPTTDCGTSGNSYYVATNLSGWQELDLIPMRVQFDGGPTTSPQTITVQFDHTKTAAGKTFLGIEDLTNFEASTPANVIFTTPVLSAPANSGTWLYTFNVSLINGAQSGSVKFNARLSAGAHYFTGASLSLGGSPTWV
jgi:hypothetical protein